MSYVYATAYWEDRMQIEPQDPEFSQYAGTYVYLLNPGQERAEFFVHCYDYEGKKYEDMEIGQLLPAQSVYSFRSIDLPAFRDPSYRKTNHLRAGWMKVVSDVPLVITAKIVIGSTGAKNFREETIWPIAFEPVEPLKLERIDGSGAYKFDPKKPFDPKRRPR